MSLQLSFSPSFKFDLEIVHVCQGHKCECYAPLLKFTFLSTKFLLLSFNELNLWSKFADNCEYYIYIVSDLIASLLNLKIRMSSHASFDLVLRVFFFKKKIQDPKLIFSVFVDKAYCLYIVFMVLFNFVALKKPHLAAI